MFWRLFILLIGFFVLSLPLSQRVLAESVESPALGSKAAKTFSPSKALYGRTAGKPDSNLLSVAARLEALADEYAEEGRVKDAKQLLKDAMIIRLSVEGADDSDVAAGLKKLTELYDLPDGDVRTRKAPHDRVAADEGDGVEESDATVISRPFIVLGEETKKHSASKSGSDATIVNRPLIDVPAVSFGDAPSKWAYFMDKAMEGWRAVTGPFLAD